MMASFTNATAILPNFIGFTAISLTVFDVYIVLRVQLLTE